MIPRGRIYAAMSGKVPDRVPVIPKIWVDLACNLTETDYIVVLQDDLLALRVIMEAGLRVGADGVRQFHFPKRRVVREGALVFEISQEGRRLGKIDIDGGWATYLEDVKDFNYEDPYIMAYHTYWVNFKTPYIRSVEEARRIAIPTGSFYEEIGWGSRQREVMRLAGERIALIGDLNSATMAFLVTMRGMEAAMMDVIENPRLVHTILEKGTEIAIERGKYVIDLGHRILRLNDSVGNMSLVSPASWREFVFPYMRAVCDELHRYEPTARIYCHICGNMMPIIEDLIETGLDCIAPLDPLGSMKVDEVRRQVGDRVSLMGGVNTLSLLEYTPEQVELESKECILGGGQRGGYILGSGCVVPRGTPKENLLAMRRAVERYGVYHNGRLVADAIAT